MAVTKTYFMLMVNEMDRAVRFYREAFDLPLRFQSPDWSEFASGDATVALHGGAPAENTTDTGLGFEVDDLEGALAAIEHAGGEVVVPPTSRPGERIRLATVADSEGNRLSVAQPL